LFDLNIFILTFVQQWGRTVLTGIVGDKWHVVRIHLWLESMVKKVNGNTLAKMSALGLIREASVVTAW